MAIRSIAQLKAWFKRGKYPTESQFADWIDSYFHKEEKIPLKSVEDLPTALNDKYNHSAGLELEKQTQQALQEIAEHKKANIEEFTQVYAGIDALKVEDTRIWEDLTGVHTDIGDLQQADKEIRSEITGLHTTDTGLRKDLTSAQTDITTIRDMLKSGGTLAQAKAALVALGANYKDVYAIASTLKAFLEASDTANTTINTWTEIEDFLQGITDKENLMLLLGQLETKITAAYKTAISSAVAVETSRAKVAESALSSKVDNEERRAEAAETALGARITGVRGELRQADSDIKQDVAGVKQTILAMQADSEGRVIPLIVEVDCPTRITQRNPITPRIRTQLLPSFALQNVLYLGDGKAVDVEPDGVIVPLELGKSRVHIIPTENTSLHKTITVEVVEPSVVKASAGAAMLTGGGNMLLT